MAWGFFNKLKNGIVKVAKGIGKVLKPVAQAILPVAKQVLPTIVETAGNAFKPGLGTVAKMGVTGLMNGLDNAINGDQQKQVSFDGGGEGGGFVGTQNYIPKQPQVIDGKIPSFQTRELTPDLYNMLKDSLANVIEARFNHRFVVTLLELLRLFQICRIYILRYELDHPLCF